METWYGAAAICINESSQLLMVLEGETEETQKWSIPTGGLEKGETFEQCVLREIEEETGYTAEIFPPMQSSLLFFQPRLNGFQKPFFSPAEYRLQFTHLFNPTLKEIISQEICEPFIAETFAAVDGKPFPE